MLVPGADPEEIDTSGILAAVDRKAVDVVAVASDPELAGQSLRRLSWALEQRGVELVVSPGISRSRGRGSRCAPSPDSPAAPGAASTSGGPHLLKNIFDRVGALVLLLLALPLMLGVAIAIKLTSRGPVILRQRRTGRGNSEFSMLKFRTMVVEAEDRLAELTDASDGNGVLFKLRADISWCPGPRTVRTIRRGNASRSRIHHKRDTGDVPVACPRQAV
ncbi:MAG TPA: sugar transferase [Kribbella sp.]|nr:sugar transferase [Kribbella sp.]